MAGFGFKLVDRSDPLILDIIEYALTFECPIEIGLFFNDPAAHATLSSRLQGTGLPIVAHLDHRQLSLLGIETKEPALREQMSRAADLGARYVVTHLGNFPMTARPEQRQRLWDTLATALDFAETIGSEHGLRVHIENTFHPLPFYQELCASLRARRQRPAHLCFDLGHAKVWSAEPLSDWMDHLSQETDAGANLHVHLHANGGLIDEHLAFSRALDIGLTGADDFTRGMTWLQALAELDQAFPQTLKIFEVPPADAIENYELVSRTLAKESEHH